MFESLPWLAPSGDREAPLLPTPAVAPSPRRPSIGLALGGGAARGFAHIGALKVLREAGYEPDVIAGTSIGAVVGGCYLAGKLDELEAWARALTRRRVLGMLDFSLGGSGLICGSRLVQALARDIGDITIEQLPKPFAAIATEIGPGHEIWLTKGSLVMAMRASLSLPGIFEPVRMNGRWLMDGALVNPVPVSTARALGARAVIAVNLNGELTGRGSVIHNFDALVSDEPELPRRRRSGVAALGAATSLVRRQLGFGSAVSASRSAPRSPGISSVMLEAFNITQDRISRSRLAGDPPDVSIAPRIGRIGPFEFQKAGEIIDAGAEAALRSLESIKEAVEALA